MTFSVYQHWDPLRVCVVGRSYPPEFYSWIKIPHVRSLFEKIAVETEEDYQNIIKKLKEFGVEVLRPDLPDKTFVNGKFVPPPMTPRDYTIMIGENFYINRPTRFIKSCYTNIKDPSWPDCNNWEEFNQLPDWIQTECKDSFNFGIEQFSDNEYRHIIDYVQTNGNRVYSDQVQASGANCARIGKDLYFGTENYSDDLDKLRKHYKDNFPNNRIHVVNTGGHSDATYCPVAPGLIISLNDIPTYKDTFPGWEVVYLPNQSWEAVKPFLKLKNKNKGKWWIPGFEDDQDVISLIETWLNHWTGYVEETVFDINMLIVDPKNVLVFNYNKTVFDALHRHGITPHIVPFRHRYFWDGGIHCITSDIHREGIQQNFFPDRS